MGNTHGLSIINGDNERMCVCCAEKQANKSAVPHLYWAFCRAYPVLNSTRCVCGNIIGDKKNEDAVERVLSLVDIKQS